VVEPGEVKGISADVTSSGSTTGTKQVQSSITYFPVDHQNLAKREDTGTLEFTISEPKSQDTDGSSGSSSTETPGFTPIAAVIACLFASILFGRTSQP
jgi:hypothetical protein